MKGTLTRLALLITVVVPAVSMAAEAKKSFLWEPVEWSYENPSYQGNPYDVIATATFSHVPDNHQIVTELYYDGESRWKLRFTGTQTGCWKFQTVSDDTALNKLTGEVTVSANPDPAIKGFLTNYKNKFAREIGENGELEAVRFNVYMNLEEQPWRIFHYTSDEKVNAFICDTRQYGFDTIFATVANSWFKFGTLGWNEHSNKNPDPKTFETLERILKITHRQGVHLQIWAWGDEYRKETPLGVEGGINGKTDRRLQRYIAARLGALPGWSLGYGFDLEEWVTEEQLGSWAKYLHEHLGWRHMVWARGRLNDRLDVQSYSGSSDNGKPFSYADAVSRLSSDPKRPHLYEERFSYLRNGAWTMDNTRRALWDYTMAGGIGAWWGFYSGDQWPKPPYPQPEQLRTVNEFWRGRFLLDMQCADELTTGGYCLKNATGSQYVFYKKDATSIRTDLSGMGTAQSAVAVDTKLEYKEIDLGPQTPTESTWQSPYKSDWAIAVGSFKR